MIPLRPLGATGASVPALGFGVSGPHATALVPRAATAALIAQALEGGAALFDTAPFYGDGEAERRLGAALAGRRDAAFVCSKAGTCAGGAKDFNPAAVTASVEGSLERLRTDRLDALLLHGPNPRDLTDALFDALEALKRHGKIRFAGVCGRGKELDAAIDCGRFDLIMAPVAAEDAARRARTAGLGVLGIEAMAGAADRLRLPTRLADLWYLARALRRRAAPGGAVNAPDALVRAVSGAVCDCVLTTTTRPAHLAVNLEIAARAPA